MPITVQCPCGERLTTKDENAGRRSKCPQCGAGLVVPPPGPAAIDTGPAEGEPAVNPWPARARTGLVLARKGVRLASRSTVAASRTLVGAARRWHAWNRSMRTDTHTTYSTEVLRVPPGDGPADYVVFEHVREVIYVRPSWPAALAGFLGRLSVVLLKVAAILILVVLAIGWLASLMPKGSPTAPGPIADAPPSVSPPPVAAPIAAAPEPPAGRRTEAAEGRADGRAEGRESERLQEEWDRLMADRRRGIRVKPSDDAAGLLNIARNLEKSGKSKGALDYYRRIVKGYPDTPQATTAAGRIAALEVK